jgi:hypothetical protein
MYKNLYNSYSPNFSVSKEEFFGKTWKYRQEAIQKYYPFFHHHNWFCKLHKLEYYTKSDILKDIIIDRIFEEKIASLPPLREYILD